MRSIDFKYRPKVVQTCFGLVDDFYKSVIREDGTLCYNFDFELSVEQTHQFPDESKGHVYTPRRRNREYLHCLKPAFSHHDILLSSTQDYGDPQEAIVITKEDYRDSSLEWTVFAYQDGELRADIILWTLKAKQNFGEAPSRVELILDGPPDTAPQVITDGSHYKRYTYEKVLDLNNLHHHQLLTSGDSRKGIFVVVLNGKLDPSKVSVEWGEKALQWCHNYWKNVRLFKNTFQIPNDDLQNMVVSCARNLLQAREKKGGILQWQVGPSIYRGFWIADGYFFLENGWYMGFGEDLFEDGLGAMLQYSRPDGSFHFMPGHDKETGIAIATLIRQCELKGDWARLKEFWPRMLRGLSFLEKLNQQSIKDPSDPYNLFPRAFIDGGIQGPFFDLTTPLWILVGLKKAATIGKKLNLEDTHRFEKFYQDILTQTLKVIKDNTRLTKEGIPFVPMNLEYREGFDHPQSATWALCHAISVGEIFPEESDIVQNFLALYDSCDNKEGIPETTGWIHRYCLWHYNALFGAQVFLYAGNKEKVVDYLFETANHAAPSRIWREENSFSDSRSMEFCGDMPHNWASVEFIRLIRHILVLEKGENLHIFRGLTPEFLPKSGKDLILEKTPTRWGDVSICLTQNNGQAYQLTIDFNFRECPAQVLLHWDNQTTGEKSILTIDPKKDHHVIVLK
ncbi:MAG: hypothetical protein ACRCY4_08480 [Brevinema sp.]